MSPVAAAAAAAAAAVAAVVAVVVVVVVVLHKDYSALNLLRLLYKRKPLHRTFPLEPLTAMKNKSIGILCFLNFLNHAMIYITVQNHYFYLFS